MPTSTLLWSVLKTGDRSNEFTVRRKPETDERIEIKPFSFPSYAELFGLSF